jgi:hypothetical protein
MLRTLVNGTEQRTFTSGPTAAIQVSCQNSIVTATHSIQESIYITTATYQLSLSIPHKSILPTAPYTQLRTNPLRTEPITTNQGTTPTIPKVMGSHPFRSSSCSGNSPSKARTPAMKYFNGWVCSVCQNDPCVCHVKFAKNHSIGKVLASKGGWVCRTCCHDPCVCHVKHSKKHSIGEVLSGGLKGFQSLTAAPVTTTQSFA